MEIPLLRDVVVIFVLAMAVVYGSQRLKLPAIVGLLATGVVAGPHALGLVNAITEVDKLAKIGVILLLFAIGIEFSLRKLMQIKRLVLVGGALQVGATVLAVFGVTHQLLGWAFGPAMFMGFLISLSSTAIVLKVLQDRAEMETPQGRIALGILIFQDVIVVLFIILTPFLAGQTAGDDGPSVLRLALIGVGLLVFVFIGARYLVPAILHQVVRTRSRELFLLTVGGICFAVAFAAAELSLALGAFLAGLTISESEYSHEVLEHIHPFRDIFTSFFFVSVGMLLDLGFVLQQPLAILLITAGVLLLKSAIVTLTSLLLGFPLRTAIISGLGLSQVGEFAFILAGIGAGYTLLSTSAEQMFLAVSVLTMAGTSFIIAGAPRLADLALRLPTPTRLQRGLYPVKGLNQPRRAELKDHLVIIGYGLNGRNVARAARHTGIPYVVVEMNADTVRAERSTGEPIFYGDATQEAVLKQVDVPLARTVVVVIAEAAATRRIVHLVRQFNPTAHIIARTRYVGEMAALYRLGASEVIPEEFETSVEIFTRVLIKYLVPREEIARLLAQIRDDGYQMFRSLSPAGRASVADLQLHLHDVEIAPLLVPSDSSLAGQTLAELNLRNSTGLTLLAIRRDGEMLANPDAATKICHNDELFVIGPPDRVAAAALYLHS
ncbi:MAG: putative cation/proton antiporter YbaL [Anaerolineae bacterium]|nr:putative cation/proton antiporter YbaL [Anaerolineae bacterium]